MVGIASADGERWREHRRFVLHVLHSLGVGKRLLEDAIREQADVLVQSIPSGAGAIDPQTPLVKAVNNVVSRLLFASNCSDDPEFEGLLNEISAHFDDPKNRKFRNLSPLLILKLNLAFI